MAQDRLRKKRRSKIERESIFRPEIDTQIELIVEFINRSMCDELRIFIEVTYEVQPSI